MAIGVSGFFDDDNGMFDDAFDDDSMSGIGICGSDTKETLKAESEEWDKDVSILAPHT